MYAISDFKCTFLIPEKGLVCSDDDAVYAQNGVVSFEETSEWARLNGGGSGI